MDQRSRALGICLLAGCLLGFILGRITAPVPVGSNRTATAAGFSEHKTPAVSMVATKVQSVPTVPGGKTLESILAIKLLEQRQKELAEFAKEVAARDIQQAITLFNRLKNFQDKAAFLEGLIEVYARTDFAGSLKFLESLPPSLFKNSAIEKALVIGAETDPQRAAEMIPQLLTGIDENNAYIRVFETWAQQDPATALNWANSNLQGQFQQATFEQIASTWGNQNPAAALDFFLNNQSLSKSQRDLALRAIVGTWAMSDGEAALSWAANYYQSSHAVDVLQTAFLNYATVDPAVAAAKAALLSDVNARNQIIPAIASTWGSVAPHEAATWISTLPAGETRSTAILELAQSWANLDPAAAILWMQKLPANEPARVPAIREAAQSWDRFNSPQMENFFANLGAEQAQEIQTILGSSPATGEPALLERPTSK